MSVSPTRFWAAGSVLTVLAAGLTAVAVSGPSPSALARGEPPTALRVPGTVSPAGSGRLAVKPQLAASSTVTLITGDRIRLDVLPDGHQSASVIPGGRGAIQRSAFTEFTWAGDQYVVPDPAVPYLGSTLDPRLFDVSYLVQAGLDDARTASLPVSITYRSGTSRPGLPGLHVTHASGRTVHGTIAKDRAGLLGQLLASQWRSARAMHSSALESGLPGVQRISLAPPSGAPAPPQLPSESTIRQATHGLPYRTLRLKFTDLHGKPAVAAGFVQDVNNASLALFVTDGKGSESVSLPEGTYSIEFSVLTPDSSGRGFETALVVKPQLAVHSDETVHLDARTAKPFRVRLRGTAAPRVQEDVLDYIRGSQAGGGYHLSTFNFIDLRLISVSPTPSFYRKIAASQLLATPTPAVTKGTFGFNAYSFFSSAPLGVGRQSTRPTYYLSFPYPSAIPASLSYQIPTAKLTAVHDRLYAPPDTPLSRCKTIGAGMTYTVYSPWDGNALELGDESPLGRRTDYWYSSAPLLNLWQAGYEGCDGVRRWGPVERIRPGEQISGNWGKAPSVPSPAAPSAYGAGSYSNGGFFGSDALRFPWRLTVCPACRQGDIGMLNLLPFGDSDPAHYSEYFAGINSSLDFYRNGKLAVTSAASSTGGHISPFALGLPMLPGRATYRLDWKQVEPGHRQFYSNTAWTFPSTGDAAGHRPAPTEQCAPDPAQPCAFLPLLFINYDLPLSTRSSTAAGKPLRVVFTVGHQQNESTPAGLSASLSVSYNDGKTWTTPRPATSEGGGTFSRTIDQPSLHATVGNVSLRVTARDRTGSSVVQTITDAYGLHA